MFRMRILGVLVCLFGSLSGVSGPIMKDYYGIDYILIPPLSANRDNFIRIKIHLGRNVNTSFFVKYNYAKENIYGDLYKEEGAFKEIERDILFPKELVRSTYLFLEFYVVGDLIPGGRIYKAIEGYNAARPNIALANEFVESYETKKNIIYYKRESDNSPYYSEVFTFENFQREQEQNYYNYLDLHKLCLKYETGLDIDLFYNDCYMYIQNSNHWFDNIGEPFGQFRKLPLSLVMEDDGYHFELTDALYIDQASNRLFSAYQDGLMRTKKLYLPKNGLSKDTIQMNINIKGVGYNESTISQTFLFSCDRNYFGDCYNSEYCISAKETESNFEFGEVEEH